jgi:protein TonB
MLHCSIAPQVSCSGRSFTLKSSDAPLGTMGSLHDTRSLTAWLAVSIALHIVAMLVLPGTRTVKSIRPEVLEVRLERVEPPKVIPPAPEVKPAPVAPPKPRLKKEKKERAEPPTPKPVARKEPPAPIETLRETPPAPPILALPQADMPVRTSPSAESEPAPRQEAASRPAVVTVAPKADAGSREKSLPVTPPNSSAAYLRNPPPRYPVSARRNGEQGTVTLRVFVTKEGIPRTVSVQTTSGSPSLDEAALEAVKSWRFVPARQGTEPVDASVLVPIVFRLDGVS